jgi:tetratricopeptide (TPR) repeat protein
MASTVPGFEYDIFISYRQKDNKYDGWVTEFVDNLKKELDATFKEEVSVYFDINPHDGLLETHDVNASLKEKLKCLVFIPIISRTYCDPKSFAWELEFKAFVEQASQDQFGLKVKLPNGNVANRVLPVRIHDLDNEDIKLCESVLGGVLRGVEFIYKESGFNRPLKPDDDEKINLNKTKYRNQTTKVALAIKEIISGLKTESFGPGKEKIQQKEPSKEVKKEGRKDAQEKPDKIPKKKMLSGIIIISVLLVIAAIFIYPKIFKRNTLDELRSAGEKISIVVMPFQNMTNDTTWNVWQYGIQENLITYLSNFSDELKILQTELVNSLIQSKGLTKYASITPSIARTISPKLDANVFLYGNIQQDGAKVRVNAKLIDSQTEEAKKTFQLEGPSGEETIFHISDSLSIMVRDYLLMTILKKDNLEFHKVTSTNSPEAYKNFMLGKNARYANDLNSSIEWFKKAIAADSNFTLPMRLMAYDYENLGLYPEMRKWTLKCYNKRDKMSQQEKLWVDFTYAEYYQNHFKAIEYLKQLEIMDDQSPFLYQNLGIQYNKLYLYDKANSAFKKIFDIYDTWGLKPLSASFYYFLGQSYYRIGQYEEARKILKIGEKDFPDSPLIDQVQAVIYLTEGNTIEANKYIKKARDNMKSKSEASIMTSLAIRIYSVVNFPDSAEVYYRKALILEPDTVKWMNNLALFLINKDKDKDIREGLNLADKALELSPDNYESLHCKGWGLYKQGKFQEAKEILQKSWNLRMNNAIYNHDAWLHLEEAKKAVEGQKK